jgi:hypothetical protein
MYRPSMRNPAILGHSAVLLFIATTRALQSDFAPHKENLPAIAAICRRLDGIPLAIDFAATRVAGRVIPPGIVALRSCKRFMPGPASSIRTVLSRDLLMRGITYKLRASFLLPIFSKICELLLPNI